MQFEKQSPAWLIANIAQANIADQFSEQELAFIGSEVCTMADIDSRSRIDWLDVVERGLKLAEQLTETRNFPWDGAANTKDPLIAVAAMQFAARASAEVIRGTDVVKCKTTGEDPTSKKEQRAKRVSTFMSYQCLEQMPEWQDDTDQLLISISPVGMYYKKTYQDTVCGRPVSVAVSPEKLIVNESVRSLKSAERATEEIDNIPRNGVIERIRSGIWRDIEKYLTDDDSGKNDLFYESHCLFDLDGDGYKEPYIVTVHKESQQVVRICCRYDKDGIYVTDKKTVQRIEPVEYYTEFVFLPNFRARFHKMGFCQLLTPMVEQINTLQNQLTDAGTLANVGGGFIGRGAKLPGGKIRFRLNEWIPVETTGQSLRDNLFPNPAKEPSGVLFNLLSQIDQKAQRMASINDTMMGDIPGGNVPASTVLASLDQALKVYTGILRRLFRGFQSEFTKLYRLNNLYLTDREYIKVLDLTPEQVTAIGIDPAQITDTSRVLVKADFDMNDCDVQPVMDPTAASEALRLARANALLQTSPGNPEVLRDYYAAIGIPAERINAYLPPPPAPQPNPAMVKLQADIVAQQEKGELERHKVLLEAQKEEREQSLTPYKQLLLEAQALKVKADAAKVTADTTDIMGQLQQQLAALEYSFNQKLLLLMQEQERREDDTAADFGGSNGNPAGTTDGAGGTVGMGEPGEQPEGPGLAEEQGAVPAGYDGSGYVLSSIRPAANGLPDGGISGEISRTEPNTTAADIAAAEQQPGSMI